MTERPFIPVRFAVLTVSDTRTLDDDRSGGTLAERIARAGHTLADRRIVGDDRAAITAIVKDWCWNQAVDVVLTTGGTGFGPRDVTPCAATNHLVRLT